MFYTINEDFVDNFFKDIYTTKPIKTKLLWKNLK